MLMIFRAASSSVKPPALSVPSRVFYLYKLPVSALCRSKGKSCEEVIFLERGDSIVCSMFISVFSACLCLAA